MRNKPYPLYAISPVSDLKELVKRQASERPDSIAFQYQIGVEKKEKSFLSVLSDSERVGVYLLRQGLKYRHIAIVAENSYEWIISFLSIVNGGMVAVPIDKDLPGNEICKLLRQSDCEAVIYSETYSSFLKQDDLPDNLRKFSISDIKEVIASDESSHQADVSNYTDYQIDVDALAAIFFTSGTTGNSKGVCLSHKNIAADMNAACRNFELTGNTLAILPFHHAFGLITAVFTLFHYAQPIYISRGAKRLVKELPDARPHTLFIVPLYLETFYKTIWKRVEKRGQIRKLKALLAGSDLLLRVGIDVRRRLFRPILSVFGGNLEYIICGGARLDPFYVKEFRRLGIEVLNGYGITECSPVISVNRNFYRKDGSVGLVIPGCSVLINDENEIVVKGDMVSAGYYRDETSTSDVFRQGFYYTGDLGYQDPDGFLYITGRKKDLIILSNGENVSPEQIEQELLRNPKIEEVVVFSEKGVLAAEVFPSETFIGNREQIDTAIAEYNRSQPTYRQIGAVYLRSTEFDKNNTKKVLRYKVKEKYNND